MKYSDLAFGDTYRLKGSDIVAERIPFAQPDADEDDPEVELVSKRTSTCVRFDKLKEGELFTTQMNPAAVYRCAGKDVATNVATGKSRVFGTAFWVHTLGARQAKLLQVEYELPAEVAVALAHRDSAHISPLLEDIEGDLDNGDAPNVDPAEVSGLVRLVGELIAHVGELESKVESFDVIEETLAKANAAVIDARRAIAEIQEVIRRG